MSTEEDPEMAQRLELLDKDFKISNKMLPDPGRNVENRHEDDREFQQ